MRQHEICKDLASECSHLPCPHFPSFLCLPRSVRHRVYLESGLIQKGMIYLNRGPQPPPPPPPRAGSRLLHDAVPGYCSSLKVPYNLLLTCQTIYAEASFILYSANRFFIHYGYSQSLQALRNLTPRSVSSLAHLTVHLNVTSCEINDPCCKIESETPQCRHQHDKPLGTSTSNDQIVLSEWQSTASYINAHVKSPCLQLHFVCDVKDLEAGTLAVMPFLHFPTLVSCSVRLGPQYNPVLQELARKTARKAAAYWTDEPGCPFRFLDLPQELRRQILEYTELVTPLREVEWNPEKGFSLRYSTWRCGDGYCPPTLHHACHFRNCWYRSNIGCFCRLRHSAYSSRCNCWSPPTSLFLVCRALQEDVQATFFMKNRFVITPSGGCNRAAECTPRRLEISIFLTSIVPRNALGFLKFLEVVFPPFDEDYLRPHEPAYQDWLRTIDYITDKLYFPTLTLRVYMADHYPSGSDVTPFRTNMTKEQAFTILNMYARTLGPLAKLNRMDRFYADLSWPCAWTRWGRRSIEKKPKYGQEQMARINREIERLVMGDDYDSTSLSKSELGNSQWLEFALRSNNHGG